MKTLMEIKFQPKLILIFAILPSLITLSAQNNSLVLETLIPNISANGYLSVDNDGNLYASEYGDYRGSGGNGEKIYKISPEGKILDSIIGLSGPMGTLKNKKGNLLISNDNNTKRGIILEIDTHGNRKEIAQINGWPIAIKKDKNDYLYFSNYNSPEIYRMAPSGDIEIYVKNEELKGAAGMEFDKNGNLIVSNFTTAKVFSINPNKEIKLIAHLKDIVNQGWGIGYITIVDNYIYATGISVSKIFKISLKNGNVEWFVGNGEATTKDGKLLEASLNYPNGIASDKKNKILYISEAGPKGGIRKIKL